ncbi:MAG: ABC transporter ATP-binding protein [Patescibacteria group bacterium]|nr:ABC transporter ATP-binding protein [bacterium]MDZ4241078.1 ABC transporter ATP-binding protein [Patescibacteria group bacterium]
MSALEITHLKKKYKNAVAVDDISFRIEKGEFFGFLGVNGAGKTTTIHCITGIATYAEGSILVGGADVKNNYREARKKVGLSPQEFNVDIFSTTRKILDYMGGYYGMRSAERKKRINELLVQFDLLPHATKPFQWLSGGLKRRVMLARALMHDPEVLILDEPTAGVDVEMRHDLWEYLQDLNKKGKTILLTSHYLEEVERLCDRIAIIHKGKIIALDKKEVFLEGGKKLEERFLELTKEEKPKTS